MANGNRRIGWRRALAVAALVWLAGCGAGPGDGAIVLEQGFVLDGPSARCPPADAPGWRPVRLPDPWLSGRRGAATAGWYRFTVTLPQAPDELWAIFLPRVGMNAAAYVNHEFVGDGGPLVAPRLSRNWNRPLFFTVPAMLLHAGPNTIAVQLEMSLSSPGFLAPVVIGPARAVAPMWRWRYLLQITAAEIALAMTLLTATVLAVIYVRRDPSAQYRWLFLAVLLWAPGTLDTLVRDPHLPTRLWEWGCQTALNWAVPCFVIGLHRALEIDNRRFERVILVVALGGAALLALVNPIYQFTTMLLWLVWTIGLGMYAGVQLVRAGWRGRHPRTLPFLVASVIGIGFGIHDVAQLLGGYSLGGPLLSTFIPQVAMAAAGWSVISHLAGALAEAEDLNRDLERRVAQKHAELERNYDKLRELERERAVTGERERIMLDMHDGMGGQLVSTLAMVESGRFTVPAVTDAIQAALDDMRLVIDSLDPVEGDLLTLLGMVRARLEPRLARHGLQFDWRVADLPPLPGFGPESALQALRIVQEAITNVVKHAGARTITVRTGAMAAADGTPGVFVDVADDGRGFGGEHPGGRGLANMRRRAAALSGVVRVEAATPGTVVHLWLPLHAA